MGAGPAPGSQPSTHPLLSLGGPCLSLVTSPLPHRLLGPRLPAPVTRHTTSSTKGNTVTSAATSKLPLLFFPKR